MENICVMFLGVEGKDKRSCTAAFCKNWGLHVRRLGVCGYGYIHRYPRKICGYGYEYGWEISYPWQA